MPLILMDYITSRLAWLLATMLARDSPPETLAQQNSPLFRIAPELREIIYRHGLCIERHLSDPSAADLERKLPAQLRTCRRVYQEGRPFVAYHDRLTFSQPVKLKSFINYAQPDALASLDSLTIRPSRDNGTVDEALFDLWRGFLVPVTESDRSTSKSHRLPVLKCLAIDIKDIASCIHSLRPGHSNYDPQNDNAAMYARWEHAAERIRNGLLFILYAVRHALTGVVPRPAWLQSSTVIRIIGLSAADLSSTVTVDMVGPQAINDFIGIGTGPNAKPVPARLTGPGRYLLSPSV